MPAPEDTLDQALGEAKRAAQDLVRASAKLAARLLSKAETFARDPNASTKRAARQVAKELESAAREVDQLLKKL